LTGKKGRGEGRNETAHKERSQRGVPGGEETQEEGEGVSRTRESARKRSLGKREKLNLKGWPQYWTRTVEMEVFPNSNRGTVAKGSAIKGKSVQ